MINLVLGRQGSGKTLFLVRQAYLYQKKGFKVYSNVKLNFPFEQLDYRKIIDCEYHDAIIILDEIQQLLPARRSLKSLSVKIVTGFLSMARKKHVTIFGSCRMPREVDVRFREESDFIYLCDKYSFHDGEWFKVLHNENLDPKIPIMINIDVNEVFSGNTIKFNFLGNPYFKMFDTDQIIKIRGIED